MNLDQTHIEIDLTTWTRLEEVEAIAEARGISTAEAIRQLVNAGLSYEDL